MIQIKDGKSQPIQIEATNQRGARLIRTAMLKCESVLEPSTERMRVMTYQTTMAVLDTDTSPHAVIAHAISVAKLFDGQVMGIVAGLPDYPMYFAEGPQAAEYLENIKTAFKKRLKCVRNQAEQKLNDQGVPCIWREPEMATLDFFTRLSRRADIIIVERNDECRKLPGLTPSNLILEAGRPVMLISPHTHTPYFARIVIAWKDSKGCRRAIVDALPLLKKAAQVMVVSVEEAETIGDNKSPVWDVKEWLQSHHVTSNVDVIPNDGDAGAAIVQYAFDHSADLIVAGAYGHSRFTEWVLGGVTDHLVNSTQHPVLFAH